MDYLIDTNVLLRALALRNPLLLGRPSDQDLLSELWVELDWLKMKAEAAADVIDEYQDSLPEDD